MLTLGIDTSNYATSLAVVDTTRQEVVCAKKRFLPVKHGELGLRQSDALFHHTAALPELFDELCREVALDTIAAIGVSEKPRPQQGSYMPCFLAGVSAASSAAAVHGVPLVKTTHQQGHIASALFGAQYRLNKHSKALMFHVSGGTTELLLIQGHTVLEQLAGTLDLYAGQAVDRLGVLLGFDFPAGAQVSELAAACMEICKPKLAAKGVNCHYSGLQNQCETMLKQGRAPGYVAKYCLSYVAQALLHMLETAGKDYASLPVFFAGGVMGSTVIKGIILKQVNREAYFVPPLFSSDNGIGTALIAAEEYRIDG